MSVITTPIVWIFKILTNQCLYKPFAIASPIDGNQRSRGQFVRSRPFHADRHAVPQSFANYPFHGDRLNLPLLLIDEIVRRNKVGQLHRMPPFSLLQNPNRRLVQQVERLLHEGLQLRQRAQISLQRLQRRERLALDLLLRVQLVDRGETLELGGKIGEVLPSQA